jgi:nucleoid-associated protein YgaU
MGIFDFVKEAGERLFGGREARAEAKQETEEALVNQVNQMGLKAENLNIDFDDGVATIKGSTASQEEREKIVLLVGNTKGIAQVDDQMTVQIQEPEAILYTVESGDSLSKIAKQQYGNAGKYMAIFDANKPMLKDPNKIYPGQVLRIPPLKG